MTKYQAQLLQRMNAEQLKLVCVDDDYEGCRITLSDDEGNDFERIQERTVQSLLDQELLDVKKQWRPSLHVYITEYTAKSPQGAPTK